MTMMSQEVMSVIYFPNSIMSFDIDDIHGLHTLEWIFLMPMIHLQVNDPVQKTYDLDLRLQKLCSTHLKPIVGLIGNKDSTTSIS